MRHGGRVRDKGADYKCYTAKERMGFGGSPPPSADREQELVAANERGDPRRDGPEHKW